MVLKTGDPFVIVGLRACSELEVTFPIPLRSEAEMKVYEIECESDYHRFDYAATPEPTVATSVPAAATVPGLTFIGFIMTS